MNNLAPYELVMVSGVSPENNVSYGFFATREQAELVGGFLMDADAQNHPEWSSYTVIHHAELEAVVRDAARYRFLRMGDSSAGVSPAVYESRSNYPIGTAMLCFDVLDEAMDEAMHNSAREG